MNNIKIDRALITGVTRFLASWIFKKSVIENIQNSRIPIDKTKNNLIYIDTIYNPLETKTLKYLKDREKQVFNGLDMFIYQGQKAFYLWNKINPEVDQELIELLLSKLK